MDEESNRDPEPTAIVARVLAGGSIRIDLPLSGIDPDGDSTQLLGFPRNPSLGSIVEQGTDWFVYEASTAGAGTDDDNAQGGRCIACRCTQPCPIVEECGHGFDRHAVLRRTGNAADHRC